MTRFQILILSIGLKLELCRLKVIVFVKDIRIAVNNWRIRRLQKKIRRDMQKFVDEEK